MSAPIPITRCRFCGTPSKKRETCCGSKECRRAYHLEWKAKHRGHALKLPPGPPSYKVLEREVKALRAVVGSVEHATALVAAAREVLDECKVLPRGPTGVTLERLEAAIAAARRGT